MPLRVLIVEDSIVSALIMEAQIHRKEPDFTVMLANDLEDALEKWEAFKPHVVLLDMHLPNSEGLETVEQISRFSPSCVVAMSADASLRLPAMEHGAKGFIEKATGQNANDLISRITSLTPECSTCFPS